jgi:hypothetical protein
MKALSIFTLKHPLNFHPITEHYDIAHAKVSSSVFNQFIMFLDEILVALTPVILLFWIQSICSPEIYWQVFQAYS